MVESKFVVLQMIPHTLFIEWDFGHYSHHCYAHLKFQAPIPSLITLGFWLQWAPSNFFKLYTLEAFSLRHNETLSSFQDLSNTTQALMNTKVHSKICK